MLVDEENMKFSSTADEQTIQRQATDLVTAYLNVAPKDEKPLGVEVSVEMPLIDPATGENLGIPMLGIMDLILDGQDGPVIADFKTSSRSSEPLDIVHEIQLTSYSYLFRQVSDRTEAWAGDPFVDKDENAQDRVPCLSGSNGRPLQAALRRAPRVSRLPGLRPVQLTDPDSTAGCATFPEPTAAVGKGSMVLTQASHERAKEKRWR